MQVLISGMQTGQGWKRREDIVSRRHPPGGPGVMLFPCFGWEQSVFMLKICYISSICYIQYILIFKGLYFLPITPASILPPGLHKILNKTRWKHTFQKFFFISISAIWTDHSVSFLCLSTSVNGVFGRVFCWQDLPLCEICKDQTF